MLLGDLFGFGWYGLSRTLAPTAAALGVSTSVSGWNALTTLRWLLLLTGLAALVLVFLQATRPAPALPATMSMVVTVLGLLSAVALLYRVLVHTGGMFERRTGAYIGLLSAIAILLGGFRSLRQEGIAERDAPAEIPTVRPQRPG